MPEKMDDTLFATVTLREGRAAGARTAQPMLDGYAAPVSGVLIGRSGAAGAPTARATEKWLAHLG